jgi:hypothetical protein
MQDERTSYLSFLRQAIDHPAVTVAFADGALRHRRMEQDFNEQLRAVCPKPEALSFPHMELAPGAYWQRNFFSILFLSIFDAIGISAERQHRYGMVLHAIRGVVTATDNILDEEAKGAVQLKLAGGKVLPNVLVMLMETGVLQEVVRDVAADRDAERRTWKALIAALFALGAEESSEEHAIETVLSPKDLLDQIHRHRGGGLLQLAFVVPELNEPQLRQAVRMAKSGVNHIGLSLQIIDDITDFDEDLTRRNHNMLRSWIVFQHPDGPCSDAELSAMSTELRKAPERHFPRATREVMRVAIEMALEGFDILNENGHPADRSAALQLIKAMFKLRGLERLWSIYEEAEAHARNSDDADAFDYRQYFPHG